MQEGSKVQTMCTTMLNTYNVKPSNPNFNKVWIFYQHKKKKQMQCLKIYNVEKFKSLLHINKKHN
jgi:hypothetical protein